MLGACLMAMPAAAQDDADGWELDAFARIEAGVTSSKSSDREDELIIVGDGGYLRGQVGVEAIRDIEAQQAA